MSDTELREIDGDLYRVERMDLLQLLGEETNVGTGASTIEKVAADRLTVEPSSRRAVWLKREVESINDSDNWRIVDVSSGKYGPKLTLERNA